MVPRAGKIQSLHMFGENSCERVSFQKYQYRSMANEIVDFSDPFFNDSKYFLSSIPSDEGECDSFFHLRNLLLGRVPQSLNVISILFRFGGGLVAFQLSSVLSKLLVDFRGG